MSDGRRAVHLAGVSHGPGRPAGSRIGNMVYSATLSGRDLATGELSGDPATQMATLFENMVSFLEAAGATIEDVIRVEFTLAAPEYRDTLNEEWLKYFHDEESLPTRKATIGSVPGGAIADFELIAVLQ
jgi:2-iminobutanoate/2-iminopropanoate deaminase